MNKNKKENYSLGIAIIALIISFAALYVNWQNLLATNRPYLKFSPSYSIKEYTQNNYEILFKLQLKNVGVTPANDIHGKTDIFLGLSDKEICVNENMESVLKDKYFFDPNSDAFNYRSIPDEEINKIEDKKLQEFFREIKTKDLTLTVVFNKRWKTLCIFPNDTFEFEVGIKISGKDAAWAAANIEKFQKIFLGVKIDYWGIFPKVGRGYYSIYNVELCDGKWMPYETESY